MDGKEKEGTTPIKGVTHWAFAGLKTIPQKMLSRYSVVKGHRLKGDLQVQACRSQLHMCSDPEQWSRIQTPPDHSDDQTRDLCRGTDRSPDHTCGKTGSGNSQKKMKKRNWQGKEMCLLPDPQVAQWAVPWLFLLKPVWSTCIIISLNYW